MASTYENDLRLEEMATGENSGSWGTKTNTNLELIADAFSYGTETIADADTTLTIADGAADAARSLALKINSSVDLTTTRTVTLAPNTTSKVWIIENNTSGGQTLTISAGSGTNITLANGTTKIIATDGIGAGSNVVELTQDIAIADLSVDGILSLADGTNSAPSLTNTGDTNTGLYFPAADEVGITVGGTQVFKADSTGANVTGTLVSDGLTVDGGATINEKLTINKQGEALTLRSGGSSTQNYVSIGRTSEDARLTMAGVANNGVNSSSAGDLVIGVNNGLVVGRQGSPYLNINSTELVINQNGSNIDFRVESDNSSSMLFVDAGNDRIGINYSTPATIMHIRGGDPDLTIEATSTSGTTLGDKNSRIMLRGNSTTAGNGSEIVWATADDANRRWAVISGHIEGNTGSSASGGLVFGTKGTSDSALHNRLQIKAGSEAVFNEAGQPFDFRIESQYNTHMFFLDADQGEIGINTSTPGSTLEVNGNFRPTYYYPHSPTSQTSSNNNYYWKLGTMYLAGPWGAELVMHGAKPGYSSGGTNVGKLTILFRGGTNASLLDAVFFAEGDNSSVPSPSVRYVPLGNYSFDIYVQLGNYASVSHTVVTGGSWTEQVVNTGTTNAPASSVGIPAQRSTWLGQNEVMSQYTYQTTINETSNDHDFRVESDSNANMLFVDAGNNVVGLGTSSTTSGRGEVGVGGMMFFEPGGTAFDTTNPRPTLKRGGDGAFQIAAGSDSSSKVQLYTAPSSGGTLVERFTVMPDGEIRTGGDNSASQTINFRTSSTAGRSVIKGLSRTDSGSVNAMSQLQLMATGASSYIGQFKVVLNGTDTYNSTNQQNCADFRGDSGLVLNQSGYSNLDFRVESDTKTHMLFVDAGADVVMVGTNSPSSPGQEGLKVGDGWTYNSYYFSAGASRSVSFSGEYNYQVEITAMVTPNSGAIGQSRFIAGRRDYSGASHIHATADIVNGTADIAVSTSDSSQTRTYTLTIDHSTDTANLEFLIEVKSKNVGTVTVS